MSVHAEHVKEIITQNLEVQHGVAITEITTKDGMFYNIKGIDTLGFFEATVTLVIMKVEKPHGYNQR